MEAEGGSAFLPGSGEEPGFAFQAPGCRTAGGCLRMEVVSCSSKFALLCFCFILIIVGSLGKDHPEGKLKVFSVFF